MAYESELNAALTAAQLATHALLRLYAEFQTIADAPADISTEADKQSQDIILRFLHERFPNDAFCAEEETATLAAASQSGSRIWIVDPIDGTRGFARKNGEFSVMIAFMDGSIIGAGVVAEPAKARVTYAAKGTGCWRRDGGADLVRCRVTTVDNLSQATLSQSRSRNPSEPSAYVTALRPARVVETHSAGIKLALVARGEADVYLNTYEAFHDWDIAAGHILVAEAGGLVTGVGGQELRYRQPGAWQRQGLLASNGRLHVAAVAALTTIS